MEVRNMDKKSGKNGRNRSKREYVRYQIRVTKDQIEQLKKLSKEKNISLNKYLINSGLDSNKQVDRVDIELNQRIYFEIGKLRLVLEKIEKKMGLGGDLASLKEIRSQFDKTMRAINESYFEIGGDSSELIS